ncbi:TlpA family protein disulfide reductase [Motilibacter deserti]|uniref:Redoxin domain-containing protein n=1 Tax=Motilibacter deserti TaxID=2714956 RepID=A0ABX0GT77_9ACTN|nr:redoxin domain-containing protein [Motilibacter deserti]
MARRWLVPLVAAGSALAGCGGTAEPSAAPAPPAGAGTSAASSAPAAGRTPAPGSTSQPAAAPGGALDFAATTLDGAAFSGASLRGKPTVLWFWAPWCPTCLMQAPGVREAITAHGDDVNLVGVAGLDKAANMPAFVEMAKISAIPHLSDEPGELWKRFEVVEQSTFVMLDADGQVVFRGTLDPDEIAGRVDALAG